MQNIDSLTQIKDQILMGVVNDPDKSCECVCTCVCVRACVHINRVIMEGYILDIFDTKGPIKDATDI